MWLRVSASLPLHGSFVFASFDTPILRVDLAWLAKLHPVQLMCAGDCILLPVSSVLFGGLPVAARSINAVLIESIMSATLLIDWADGPDLEREAEDRFTIPLLEIIPKEWSWRAVGLTFLSDTEPKTVQIGCSGGWTVGVLVDHPRVDRTFAVRPKWNVTDLITHSKGFGEMNAIGGTLNWGRGLQPVVTIIEEYFGYRRTHTNAYTILLGDQTLCNKTHRICWLNAGEYELFVNDQPIPAENIIVHQMNYVSTCAGHYVKRFSN
jgi:hypothetical protein